MVQFIVIAAIVLIGVCLLLYFNKDKSGNWIQFFAKGKEAGFNNKDLELLRKLISGSNVKDPVSIFKNQNQFEIVIRLMVKSVQLSGDTTDPQTHFFLAKLFDYYKKIEREASDAKTRITSSRQISEGQLIRVLVPGTGVYKSEVVKNFGNYLTISRPVNAKMSSSMQWQGNKISVYFWREDDAGYVFDTDVIDEVFSKGISSIKVEHCDSLFRTQKRNSMRLKFKRAAFLYLINDSENPHSLEKNAGVRCQMEDISDTGCAFRINGQASAGMRLKVQFLLNRIPICIPATVRSVDYKEDNNTSLVHMEADPLPIETRNQILCEVFNMMPEDDDELPLRITDEEADTVRFYQTEQERQKDFNEVMNG